MHVVSSHSVFFFFFSSFPPVLSVQHVHIVMELCSGELFEQLQTRGRYTEGDAAAVTRTLLATIQFCHSRGVMHRDVKLENVLLASQGSCTDVKLIDFGIAAFVPRGEVDGVHGYAALRGPGGNRRQLRAAGRRVVRRGGAVCAALGAVPFGARTDKAVLKRVASAQLKLSEGPWEEVSEGAKHLVQAMLARQTRTCGSHPRKHLGGALALHQRSSPTPHYPHFLCLVLHAEE